jgi:hypothetical protein
MKSITYLALVALIFLSACKGSSFLNQRYTNYNHSKTKTTSVSASKKVNPPESKIKTKKQEDLKVEAREELVCHNTFNSEDRNPVRQKSVNQLSIKGPIAFASKQFKTITDKHLKIQKEKKSKEVNANRGAAKTFLKIILAILILAIIVGIIVIIALLA